MPRILHVAAHLGGGVGNVLSSIAGYSKKNDSIFSHEVMQLEPTENTHFLDVCIKSGISVCLASEVNIKKKIEEADIIQMEWWHHPLTMEFMYEYLNTIPCRMVIWSHISGCNYPCIPAGLIRLPEKFIFASPYSYENYTWTENERSQIRDLAELVVSSSGNYSSSAIKKETHEGFHIGYVGFLNYNKTNPDFVKYCAAVDINQAFFTVVGDTAFAGKLIADVKEAGLWDRFNFTGYSSNVNSALSSFDVFGCLLNPQHTGTAENALLEAMAAEVPPVVLNQCAEKFIVKNGETGVVVENAEEYDEAMRYLYKHPKERIRIGKNASTHVREKYSIKNTVAGLEKVYTDTLNLQKKQHNVASVFGENPYSWFNACLGDKNNLDRISDLIFGPSKSSIYQYIRYFPNDTELPLFFDQFESLYKEKFYKMKEIL